MTTADVLVTNLKRGRVSVDILHYHPLPPEQLDEFHKAVEDELQNEAWRHTCQSLERVKYDSTPHFDIGAEQLQEIEDANTRAQGLVLAIVSGAIVLVLAVAVVGSWMRTAG